MDGIVFDANPDPELDRHQMEIRIRINTMPGHTTESRNEVCEHVDMGYFYQVF
jgi:hypothetical protein